MNLLTKSFALTACALSMVSISQAQEMPDPGFFIGSWGVVAFNDDSDLMKMAGVARGYCGQPYHIRRKSPDSFTMFVEKKLTEVMLHADKGQFYIVPVEATNNVYEGARELRIINDRTFTLEYLESDLNALYGRNVFVRCGR